MSFQAGPLNLATETDMSALASRIAPLLQIGDTLLLSGPVGAGKSAFARALIRARLNAPTEDVPSPTFTLVQTYEAPDGDIWHCDLYRLTHVDEAIELGLEDAFTSAICLIEWPDRLGDLAPASSLHLTFRGSETSHSINLTSHDNNWQTKLRGVLQ